MANNPPLRERPLFAILAQGEDERRSQPTPPSFRTQLWMKGKVEQNTLGKLEVGEVWGVW